jgi:hypothetical protein
MLERNSMTSEQNRHVSSALVFAAGKALRSDVAAVRYAL